MGAWDDFATWNTWSKATLASKRNQLAKAMQQTLLAAKRLVPRGHVIVVGPADGPQIDEKVARKLNATENSVATQLNLPYISPVQGGWFTTDPRTHQDNRGFISIDNAPTDAGQVHILYEMESALANLNHVALGQNGTLATDPVPPVLPTTTLAPVTQVSVSTVMRTSVTPVTRTVSEPNVTVTPPPVVVTVTVPASSP